MAESMSALREENERLRCALVLARMRLESLPVSPRILIVIEGIDRALEEEDG